MKKKVLLKKRNVKITRKRKRRKINFFRKTWVKRIFLIISFLTLISALVFGGAFALGLLFCVRSIEVSGSCDYDPAQITEVSEIKEGSNWLFVNSYAAEGKIYNAFPYIDSARVIKKFPNKIEISAEKATPLYSVLQGSEYLLISTSGKVLEKSAEKSEIAVNVRGIETSVSKFNKIEYKDEKIKKLVDDITNSFKNNGLTGMKDLDLSNSENIIVNYDNRIKIFLGNDDDIDYKILTIKEIILGKISSLEKGTLDLRNLKKENRSYFTPEE